MEPGNEVVRIQNVGLRYGLGPEVLNDVSLSLAAGSFRFLTGASGAGKTSLLRLMYLAMRPSRGLVHLFGQEVSALRRADRPALRRRIGVIFQDFRLIEHLSAMENVALPLRVSGASEALIREHVPELLRWVGLQRELDALPSALSGGQKQRVAIARAVIARPDLLLADEPTGNVDQSAAVRLMYLLDRLNKLGTTVVIATHNEALVDRFGYPAFKLEDGVLRAYQSRATAAAATPGP